ncbi:MAG: hypothetical protein K2O27_03415 [Candidatus Amulumruptor sp.]|nr:hypothetical protein [Candidatus Amulumruptor sp.]
MLIVELIILILAFVTGYKQKFALTADAEDMDALAMLPVRHKVMNEVDQESQEYNPDGDIPEVHWE